MKLGGAHTPGAPLVPTPMNSNGNRGCLHEGFHWAIGGEGRIVIVNKKKREKVTDMWNGRNREKNTRGREDIGSSLPT